MRRAWAVALLGMSIALTARAQAPDLAGPDGAVETSRIAHELDTYPMPVAPFGGETSRREVDLFTIVPSMMTVDRAPDRENSP